MFLLSFIPDSLIQWIVHVILLAGIAGIAITTAFKFFIKYIPWIIPYRTILQVVSLVLLVAGVYFKGGIAVEMEWRSRVKELEEKVAKAEAQSKDANEKIKTVYVDRVKIVKEQQVVVQEKIKEVQVKIDSQCKITTETIDILNNSAKGIKK
jgi:hypothetical protein